MKIIGKINFGLNLNFKKGYFLEKNIFLKEFICFEFRILDFVFIVYSID